MVTGNASKIIEGGLNDIGSLTSVGIAPNESKARSRSISRASTAYRIYRLVDIHDGNDTTAERLAVWTELNDRYSDNPSPQMQARIDRRMPLSQDLQQQAQEDLRETERAKEDLRGMLQGMGLEIDEDDFDF